MDWESFLQKYQWQLSLFLLGLVLVGLGILGSNFWSEKEEGIEIISSEETRTGSIFVDIQGAVEKPGVYQVPANSHLNDLFIAAGGLSSQADREWVAGNLNLAQSLEDGAKIYVPKKGEAPLHSSSAAGNSKININTASKSELETLPGIGSSYAQKIIENRPYQKIDDILKVPGIGPKTLEKIKEKITVW